MSVFSLHSLSYSDEVAGTCDHWYADNWVSGSRFIPAAFVAITLGPHSLPRLSWMHNVDRNWESIMGRSSPCTLITLSVLQTEYIWHTTTTLRTRARLNRGRTTVVRSMREYKTLQHLWQRKKMSFFKFQINPRLCVLMSFRSRTTAPCASHWLKNEWIMSFTSLL